MKGRKEVVWALVVSAALFTAGLVLSCGDDNGNGDGAAATTNCQEACENLWECGWISYFYCFGYNVRDCVYSCKQELAGDGGGFTELYQCISDTTDCEDLAEDCFFQNLCETFIDCEIWGGTVSDCVDYCYDDFEYCVDMTLCSLAFSSCSYIVGFCD